jgi:hypothetical protein
MGVLYEKLLAKIYFFCMLVKTLTLYEAESGLNQMAQQANMNVRHENIHPLVLFKMNFLVL